MRWFTVLQWPIFQEIRQYFVLTMSGAPHLWHDDTDVVDALYDGLAAPRDGDGSLCTVGQHLTRHLDTGPGHLPDLLDLAPSLPYQTPALAGRHHQPEGDGGAGDGPRGDQVVEVLTTPRHSSPPQQRNTTLTSSNLLQIRVNALKIASVFPVTVTIRSGQLPSLMLILAPLCNWKMFHLFAITSSLSVTSSLNIFLLKFSTK